MSLKGKQEKLTVIAEQVAKCTRCSLYRQATKAVPGEGSPDAEIMFIGEAPGFHEDQRGIPFCGAAGKLLDKLLLSVKIDREKVFIGNMIKHRPPGNRDPLPEELKACQRYLDEQIRIIDPKIIVTLGRFSMRKFLPGEYISSVHGQARYVDFMGKRRIVIPMYHPAAALRNGKIRQLAQEDFLKIPKFLGKETEPENLPTVPQKEATGEQLSLV
jgi:uracil-DNA glycosylase family 4